MTTMRLIPEEVDALDGPVTSLKFMLAGAQEAAENDDKKLLLSYLEIAQEQAERIAAIHAQMAEPVPV